MNYQFTYRTSVMDFWQVSMYYIYGSLVGVCNIIFTVAMILLAIVRWNSMGDIYRIIVAFCCCLFTVIQPMVVYNRARKKAGAITEDTTIVFDNAGIHVTVGNKHETLRWNTIKRVSKKPTMLIVFSNTTHGFILGNRVLGKQRNELYEFITSKMEKK